MRYWIEVTSGLRWEKLLKSGVVLKAPNIKRYRNFFKEVRAGDKVLHYLTNTLTPEERKRSSIVGLSTVSMSPRDEGRRIVADCSGTVELHEPVPLTKLRGIKDKSDALDTLIKMSMQRYLTEITETDFKSILDINPGNRGLF